MAVAFLTSLVLHPASVFVAQNAFTVFAFSFTKRSSRVRHALLLVSLVGIYAVFPTYVDRLPTRVVASIVAGMTFANVLSYVDWILLCQWSYEGGNVYQKGRSSSRLSDVYNRLRYGFFVNANPRLIGIEPVKNTPAYKTSDPQYIPSRASFLVRKSIIVCACYVILDLATSITNAADNPTRYAVEKIPLFGRWGEVTREEIITKLIGGVGYWAASYCTIQCYMGAWAFLCVACGSDPQFWRPYFGPLSEGYTIRRFWGTFWHQLLRRPFTSIATFLTNDGLYLPKHSIISRYLRISLVFLISGLLHLFTEVAAHGGGGPSSDLSFSDSQCVRFFLTQAAGILIEDGVQEVGKRLKILNPGITKRWRKLLGWVWLIVFLGWSTPALMYPAARLNSGRGKDILLPFSVLKALKR